MRNTLSDDIEVRNKAIATALSDTTRPISSIVTEYGLSKETIRKIGRQQGVPPRAESGAGRKQKLEHSETISEMHRKVGLYFARHRSRERLTPKAFAERVKISVPRLRAIEMGTYAGLTLLDLQKLCEECGVSVAEVTSYEARAA